MDNDHHDHSANTHTMSCPVCQAPISVHAHDDEEAVNLIMQAGIVHFEEAGHPKDQAMTPEEMEKMTRESIKRVA